MRKRKYQIKLKIHLKRPYSKLAIQRWSAHMRSIVKPTACPCMIDAFFDGKCPKVHVSWLHTEKRIRKLIRELPLPDGTYYALGYTGKRPGIVERHGSRLTTALFNWERSTSMDGKVTLRLWGTQRLSHYWFWQHRLARYPCADRPAFDVDDPPQEPPQVWWEDTIKRFERWVG